MTPSRTLRLVLAPIVFFWALVTAGGCAVGGAEDAEPQLSPATSQLTTVVVQMPMRRLGTGLPAVTASFGGGGPQPGGAGAVPSQQLAE